MKHVVKHDLDLAVAKNVMEKAFGAYKEKFEKYNPTLNWTSEHRGDLAFEAKGAKIKGAVELKPGAIEIDLEVPFLLRPFTGKAVEVIEREIQKWVGKAKAGEV